MAFNLEHPIELVINGCSSNTSPIVFGRTQINFNNNDYDGATYFVEMVAYNSTGGFCYPQIVYWDGDSWEPCAEMTIAASTTISRYRQAFSPVSGANVYALKLPATAVIDTLRVYAARIIVRQSNATKTRIQIPLLIGNYSGYTSNDTPSTAYLLAVAGGTYSNGTYSYRWKKREENMLGLSHFDLDFVAYTDGGTAAYLGMYNVTDASIVSASEVNITSTSGWGLSTVQISNSATGFHDGDEFEIRAKNNATNITYAGTAYLYATYTDMTKLEVYQRVAGQASAGITSISTHYSRSQLNQTYMGDGSVEHYIEACGYCLDTVGDDWFQLSSYNDQSTYDTSSPYTQYLLTGALMDSEYNDSTRRNRRTSFTPNSSGYDYWGTRLVTDLNSLWTGVFIVSVISSSGAPVTMTSAPQFGIG